MINEFVASQMKADLAWQLEFHIHTIGTVSMLVLTGHHSRSHIHLDMEIHRSFSGNLGSQSSSAYTDI